MAIIFKILAIIFKILAKILFNAYVVGAQNIHIYNLKKMTINFILPQNPSDSV